MESIQGAPCAVYTTTKKDLSHVAIILKEDDAEEEEEEVETASNVASGRRNPVVEKVTFDQSIYRM